MRKIVFNETEIQGACERIANELTKDLANDEKIPVFLGVMKGALNFFMDLTKRMEIPIPRPSPTPVPASEVRWRSSMWMEN